MNINSLFIPLHDAVIVGKPENDVLPYFGRKFQRTKHEVAPHPALGRVESAREEEIHISADGLLVRLVGELPVRSYA
jgi:hypothetical protein